MKKKYCDVGQHECEKLFHARTKERLSSCPLHAPRTPIKKGTPIGEYVMTSNKPRTEAKKHKGEVSLPDLLKLATMTFNLWIRRRDTLDGTYFKCISCGSLQKIESADCGHYMPSTYSELKFNELNCHAECKQCNQGDINHLLGYRVNLIQKIGVDKVLWLEETPLGKEHKWTREELNDIIQKYK